MDRVLHHLDTFRKSFEKKSIPYRSKYACAIMEPRHHSDLEFVIKNMAYFLPGWSMYIFHSLENSEYVRNLVRGHNEMNINFIMISKGNINVSEYSKILSTPQFYEFIHAEYVLIFQTDSYLRRFGMEEYVKLGYDYIGAPWPHEGWDFQAGNGGLSLRKISKMLEVTHSHPWNGEPEDLYFQHALMKSGGKMCNKYWTTMAGFSVENIFHPNPLGVHKYWQFSHLPTYDMDLQPKNIRIKRAVYGVDGNYHNVTNQVQTMYDIENTLWANNHYLGDPVPDQHKILEVELENDKKYWIKEGNYVLVDFRPEFRTEITENTRNIEIKKAVYGTENAYCDVSSEVKNIYEKENVVLADNKYFGDPIPNIKKKLVVDVIVDGQERHYVIEEGDHIIVQ